MKSMEVQSCASKQGQVRGSQSESLHTPHLWPLGSWAAACLAQRWITVAC